MARIIAGAAAALKGILVQESFGLFDAGYGQIMRLNAVTVMLDHEQVHARGMKNTNDNYRK